MPGEKHIPYGESVGALVGRGADQNLLRAAVAFVESQKAPMLGEFLVIEESELRKRRLLCRVDDVTYGDFHTTQDERERTLVEKYVRDVSGHKRALSEEEKRMLFFQLYTLRVLGEFRQDAPNGSFRIATDYRVLPSLTALLRYPTEEELKILTRAGLTAEDKELSAIGHLAFGEYECKNIPIYFDVSKFEARRTAIFARTGYGKSNLAKFVVALAGLSSQSGLLVLDLDGEYAFSRTKKNGDVDYGLCDLPQLHNKLEVFTHRAEIDNISIHSLINLLKLDAHEIQSLMVEQDKTSVDAFTSAMNNETVYQAWQTMIQKWQKTKKDWQTRETLIREFIKSMNTALEKSKTKPDERVIRRELNRLLPLHDEKAGNLFEDVNEALLRKKLVILDLSSMPVPQAMRISERILYRIFSHNLSNLGTKQQSPVIAVFEEAQNVLNKKAVEAGESIFVRWAKEGRKFGLGLIYITQQPGAIAEEIVSQTDNFFVMHLLSKNDVDALIRANRHYDGVIAHFLVSETVVGNTYVYSAPYQPYVFPAHIWEFKPEIFKEIFGEPNKNVSKAQPQLL